MAQNFMDKIVLDTGVRHIDQPIEDRTRAGIIDGTQRFFQQLDEASGRSSDDRLQARLTGRDFKNRHLIDALGNHGERIDEHLRMDVQLLEHARAVGRLRFIFEYRD
jgi:hypothetical protein